MKFHTSTLRGIYKIRFAKKINLNIIYDTGKNVRNRAHTEQ